MNIEITDEQLRNLVETSIYKYVGNRIENVMNYGQASWFTQSNIKRVTQQCIMEKLEDVSVRECLEGIDKKYLVESLSKAIESGIANYLFE